MSKNVFGSNWYKDYVDFQKNPKHFVDRRRLTRDDFCIDILKDLYSDSIHDQCKCHLLLILQEHHVYLVQNEALLEQIVGSLHNLYSSFTSPNDNKLLKMHILVTMTSLLLTWKNQSEAVKNLVNNLQCLLLNIICKEQRDTMLKTTACQCLQEMEMFTPGLLQNHISKIVSSNQSPDVPPIQSIVVLLSHCLKHKVELQENLDIKQKANNKSTNTLPKQLASPTRSNEIQYLVACIFDALPSMGETSSHIVLENLMYVVKKTPNLLPAVFKSFLPKLIMSLDVLYFQLALHLLESFGSSLFSNQEEKRLLLQFQFFVGLPTLSKSQRLIYFDWLQSAILKNVFSINIPLSLLEALVPGPFDDVDMQAKKISILCSYFQSHPANTTSPEFLLCCLNGLKRQVMLSDEISTATAFFRSLYKIFICTNNAAIHLDIQKLILDVLSTKPKLSPFVLDFLKCIKKESTGSAFSNNIFNLLVNHVLNLTVKQCSQDIGCLLPILEAAIFEAPTFSKPQLVLRQLKNILAEPSLLGNDFWMLGHDILSYCCTALRFHDVETLYHDLGELLNLVMINIQNCDCQDRAKQYYAALTSLPQTKIKELFKSQPLEEKGNISLTEIVTGDEATFHSGIIELTQPVFELIRLEGKHKHLTTEMEVDIGTGVEKYTSFIHSSDFIPKIKIPFTLRLHENILDVFETLYCVVISIHSNTELSVPDIEVPILKSDQDVLVELEFIPKAPNPVLLNFRACFTCNDNANYQFSLPSTTLELWDLFSPLPTSFNSSLQPKQFFKNLWKEQLSNENSCLSVFQFATGQRDLHVIVDKWWKDFILYYKQDEIYFIGIFLPPSSHLLMRITTLNDAGLADILTEKTILPFISTYVAHIAKTDNFHMEKES